MARARDRKNPEVIKSVLLDAPRHEWRVTLRIGTVITLVPARALPVAPRVGETLAEAEGPTRGLVQARAMPSRYDAERLFYAMRYAARAAIAKAAIFSDWPMSGDYIVRVSCPGSVFCRFLRKVKAGVYNKGTDTVDVSVMGLLRGMPTEPHLLMTQAANAAWEAAFVLHGAGITARIMGKAGEKCKPTHQ